MLGWILKYPKQIIIVAAIALVGAHLVHYKYLQGKVDRLSVEKVAIQRALDITAYNLRVQTEALAIEREAVNAARRDREAAEHAISDFLRNRANDPVAVEWAAVPVPEGELVRICEALPELEGCE